MDITQMPGRIPMPLLNAAFVPGHCKEAILAMEDDVSRDMAQAEYDYFSGQAEKAAARAAQFLEAEDLALRLSACWVYGYANLATGHIEQARRALGAVQQAVASITDETPVQTRAFATFVVTGASVLLHLPLGEDVPPLQKALPLLPPGIRLFALYVQAHAAYLEQEYGRSIGIVETALALESEAYPIASIYLHLVATMDYMSLKAPQQAREHLLAAWQLARPDDLIEALGEHHGLLGGMLEAVIKREWPDDFRRIIAITYNFSAGWRRVHNPVTGQDVADNLTTTEFAASMLAARGWSNKEICDHLGVSANTVKQHISTAMRKLGVAQRRDLERHMLR